MDEEEKPDLGSGNVFADIGVRDPDEALLKAKLAYQISSRIEQQGLTQSEAAGILGVDQPKVSALMRGRLSGFSIERLLRFARSLEFEVEIHLKPAATRDGCASAAVPRKVGKDAAPARR